MKDFKFEYVVSGTSYIRVNHNRFMDNPSLIDTFNHWAKIIRTETDQELSLLFNAFSEKDFGEKYVQSGIDKNVDNIYSDSGGLQIVTRGSVITPEIKKEIYDNQCKWSKFAMCFDEIPVKMVAGGVSKRGDTKNRFFDKENLKEYAIQTGKNINEQITHFKKKGKDDVVPVIIVHGQTYDDYMIWCENIIKQIDKSNRHVLKCVAISSASSGGGQLEEIRKAFLFKHLPFEDCKHLHILGLGSVKRLAPMIMFAKAGYYDGYKISYDSTTHSSSSTLGSIILRDNTRTDLGRNFNNIYYRLHEEISEKFDLGYDAKTLHKSLSNSVTDYTEKFGDPSAVIRSTISTSMNTLYNFIVDVDKYVTGEKEVFKFFGKDVKIYKNLSKIKSLEDYLTWEDEEGYVLDSKKIQAELSPTLESFFS